MPAYCAARSYIGLVFNYFVSDCFAYVSSDNYFIMLSRLFQSLYRVRGQY